MFESTINCKQLKALKAPKLCSDLSMNISDFGIVSESTESGAFKIGGFGQVGGFCAISILFTAVTTTAVAPGPVVMVMLVFLSLHVFTV